MCIPISICPYMYIQRRTQLVLWYLHRFFLVFPFGDANKQVNGPPGRIFLIRILKPFVVILRNLRGVLLFCSHLATNCFSCFSLLCADDHSFHEGFTLVTDRLAHSNESWCYIRQAHQNLMRQAVSAHGVLPAEHLGDKSLIGSPTFNSVTLPKGGWADWPCRLRSGRGHGTPKYEVMKKSSKKKSSLNREARGHKMTTGEK